MAGPYLFERVGDGGGTEHPVEITRRVITALANNEQAFTWHRAYLLVERCFPLASLIARDFGAWLPSGR